MFNTIGSGKRKGKGRVAQSSADSCGKFPPWFVAHTDKVHHMVEQSTHVYDSSHEHLFMAFRPGI